MNAAASRTSGTTIISGSRQRFQASRMAIASSAVTPILTNVSARSDPHLLATSRSGVRCSTNQSATRWSSELIAELLTTTLPMTNHTATRPA